MSFVLFRSLFKRFSSCRQLSMLKSHRNCVIPGCPNRRDRFEWGLFRSGKKVGGGEVYVKRRLCGIDNCRNQSTACQSVTFRRYGRTVTTGGNFESSGWEKLHGDNIPLSSHSCACAPCISLVVSATRRRETLPIYSKGIKFCPNHGPTARRWACIPFSSHRKRTKALRCQSRKAQMR